MKWAKFFKMHKNAQIGNSVNSCIFEKLANFANFGQFGDFSNFLKKMANFISVFPIFLPRFLKKTQKHGFSGSPGGTRKTRNFGFFGKKGPKKWENG